jgi:cytoskeletal protein CcmA (bactofilin family)
MFRKTSKEATGEASMADKKVVLHPSIISRGLVVTGDLVSDGEIQVDGRVQGDVQCASLVIGITGEVLGEVRTANLRLHGQLTGQVHAESVFLAATARMVGDVHHQSLAIEPGAFLQGMCRRNDDEMKPQAIAAPTGETASAEDDESAESPRLIQGKPVRGLVGVAS